VTLYPPEISALLKGSQLGFFTEETLEAEEQVGVCLPSVPTDSLTLALRDLYGREPSVRAGYLVEVHRGADVSDVFLLLTLVVTKRNAAVQELFSSEPTMYEPAGIVTGQTAISEVAGALLKQFGPDFSFVAEGVAVGHHGLAYLKWRAGPANGPVIVSGVDVAEVSDGRILRLWVLLDAPQG